MNKPFILGISGGSGSGKTYLLEQILKRLPPEQLTLVSQDNYYFPLELQAKDREGLVNFDHPDSIDLLTLHKDLQKILMGETIYLKEYSFNNPAHQAKDIRMKPSPIIILEGLFIYHLPELRTSIDLKIFVDAPDELRLSRRLKRDKEERGYSEESILRDYERFVAPMYTQFVEPCKNYCDFIIPNTGSLDKVIDIISNHLQEKLG